MLDLVREILQTLSHNKLRTALTGIAVAWGIFMLIVLLGASRGLSNNMRRHSTMESSSFLSLWSGRTSVPYKGYKEGRYIELEKDDLGAIASEGGSHVVEAMGNVYLGDARISSNREYISGGIDGVYPGAVKRERVKIIDGRFINDLDLRERRKVLVLNEGNAKVLFGSEDSAVGRRVNCLGLSWTVVGVYADSWNRDSYAPFSTVMMLKGNSGKLYTINVKLSGMQDMADVEQVEKDVRAVMARHHDFSEDDKSAVYMWNRFEGYLSQQTASRVGE
ncbi:MAG: ABC transporter permease, partial [Muribaculaceae bacterium]|nr:ABC transporter permease [Muribaculaceae bacterium]